MEAFRLLTEHSQKPSFEKLRSLFYDTALQEAAWSYFKAIADKADLTDVACMGSSNSGIREEAVRLLLGHENVSKKALLRILHCNIEAQIPVYQRLKAMGHTLDRETLEDLLIQDELLPDIWPLYQATKPSDKEVLRKLEYNEEIRPYALAYLAKNTSVWIESLG